MFHKDTFRLIKKTRKRFITIMLIVLIGVGFMVGLMSSAPTMRGSVDKYYDDTNFMDLQLYSSYGFDDRDVDALKKSDNVDSIFATRFLDAFADSGDSTIITRVQELQCDINTISLVDGRMPSAPDEAVALGSSSFGTVFNIGDTVSLYLEDSELSESLSVTEYKIVGIVKTPQYMASSKETSTLNNLNLSTVIYVDQDNFLQDYYTSLYLTFEGSKEYTSFTDEYKDFISENIDDLDKIIRTQQIVRRDEVYEEVAQEVADGEKELEEKIADAQKEIDDGKKQLDDGYVQVLVGEAQLESSRTQIEAGEKEIAANEKLLRDSEKQITDAKKQVEEETGMEYEEASSTIKMAYGVYNLINAMLESEDFDPDSSINRSIQECQDEIDTLQADNTTRNLQNIQYRASKTPLENQISELEDENTRLLVQNEILRQENTRLEAEGNTARIEANLAVIEANEAEIARNKAEISSIEAEIQELDDKVSENDAQISENNRRINELSSEITQLQSIGVLMGDEVLGEIPGMINDMFNGDIKGTYEGIIELEDAREQVDSGKQQLEDAKLEIESGKKQIAEAEEQLADGREEYEKGKKELEDAQKELDEEYEKARIELDKARQQLAELPEAEWTLLDRDMHYSTYMFENNADQMAKIGYVFPLLFFLVAALVCMTTMKRLVDEERSQIGVFSALGFTKGQIISKYVIYALTASLIGSLVSIPIGINIFPVVIYFCWHLMYDLPEMVLTMPTYIAVLGVCSFTVLMVLVTFVVVRGVLKENPSQLMRPKAPKNAKKVFLEYISFIWKRLSFTSKVTARNIIRYKSRFFMTVIGVAGCTSLLVLGFGIKDSVSQVVSIQYGDIITYDNTITLEDKDYGDDVLKALEMDKNVEYAVPLMSYSAKVYTDDDENTLYVYVMDEDEIANVINLRQRNNGEELSIRKGAVISEKFAKLYNIDVGDEITVESSNGIKKEVKVTGICEMYTQHYLFISEENYEYTFNETVNFDQIAITSIDSDALVEKYSDMDGVKTISDFTDMKATFNNMFDSLDIIILVIILAAGSLALVVIMNLTEVNISERIREIATLKVLGFNDGEVYSYIFKEVFILSLIGMIIGLPFGKLELVFVMGIIDMEMVMFSTNVQLTSYLYGFLITMAFTILVIMMMRKTLRNVEMVESLKSVE